MARTSLAQMQLICNIDTTLNVVDFIATANELITEMCVVKGPQPPRAPYTDVRLELIERWLACHFYSIQDPQAASESVGKLREDYQQVVGLGFYQTRYGQQAMALDTNGSLAALNRIVTTGIKRPTIGVLYVGGTLRNRPCH